MSDLKEKLKGYLKQTRICLLATVTEDGKPWSRYMMVQSDADLTLRCATFIKSRKVDQINRNPEVHIVCGAVKPDSMDPIIQIQARAEISTDKDERHALWNPILERYFSGPDDSNYCVLIIKPYRIELMEPGIFKPVVWEP